MSDNLNILVINNCYYPCISSCLFGIIVNIGCMTLQLIVFLKVKYLPLNIGNILAQF